MEDVVLQTGHRHQPCYTPTLKLCWVPKPLFAWCNFWDEVTTSHTITRYTWCSCEPGLVEHITKHNTVTEFPRAWERVTPQNQNGYRRPSSWTDTDQGITGHSQIHSQMNKTCTMPLFCGSLVASVTSRLVREVSTTYWTHIVFIKTSNTRAHSCHQDSGKETAASPNLLCGVVGLAIQCCQMYLQISYTLA